MSRIPPLELDFSFVEFLCPNFPCNDDDQRSAIRSQLCTFLKDASRRNWKCIDLSNSIDGIDSLFNFVCDNGSHATVRYYKSAQTLTFDVHEQKSDAIFSHAAFDAFIDRLKCAFNAEQLRQVISIPRVSKIPQLYLTSDARLSVYDFDDVLCDVRSPYQHIKVLHSTQFGNTLILDDYINLAEKDLVYTHKLMWKGDISYANKQILVLGGGDGGVLNEVLKENPGCVTMLEIDEMVMEMCKKYLRGACGDSLDSLSGPRHEIIVDDCFNQLQKYIDANRQFDILFSDLTDVPLLKDGTHELREFWSLMRRVLEMGLRVLKPDGLFLTHLVGGSATSVINEYEKMLNDWREPRLAFQRSDVMVPSFLEIWTFYKIYRM